MDVDSSNDIMFISALCRELQECLAETMITMENHVDGFTGQGSDTEENECNNNLSGIVRDVGGSGTAESLAGS